MLSCRSSRRSPKSDMGEACVLMTGYPGNEEAGPRLSFEAMAKCSFPDAAFRKPKQKT